jgi:hypothetical protein
MVLVDSKYLPSMVSRTASFVDRARPDEKAIFARVVSTRSLQLCQSFDFTKAQTILNKFSAVFSDSVHPSRPEDFVAERLMHHIG